MAATLRITGIEGNDTWIEINHTHIKPGPDDVVPKINVSLTFNTVSGGKIGEIVMETDDAQALLNHLANIIPPPQMFMGDFIEE